MITNQGEEEEEEEEEGVEAFQHWRMSTMLQPVMPSYLLWFLMSEQSFQYAQSQPEPHTTFNPLSLVLLLIIISSD